MMIAPLLEAYPILSTVVGGYLVLFAVERIWKFLTKPKIDFREKHVFITGGTKGLGREFAKLAASKGAKVTIIARGKEALEDAKKEIESISSFQVGAFTADVSDMTQLSSAVEAATRLHGIPDVLIPCAGSALPGLLVDTSAEVYRSQIEINYLGSVYAVKAILPAMLQRGSGRIVLVSSGLALTSFVGYSQYAPSKWAVRSFGDALRNELIGEKVLIQQFYPSNMDTPGYVVEEQAKPVPTKEIEGATPLISASQSALDLYNGILGGQYHITQEWSVELLRVGLNSITPRNNFWGEVPLLFLLPFIQWGVTRFLFDHTVRLWKANKGKKVKGQ